MVKVFHDEDVLTAARKRVAYLFDEFEDVYVTVSGGKDSTVVMDLALTEARKRGRRLGVFFLDQEFEWQATIDMIREWMHLPDVDPYWLQCPMRMSNSNSATDPWCYIWHDFRKDKWMREREPDSMHEPFCESDRFHETMASFIDWRESVTGRKSCGITGLRAEESFNRFRTVTVGVCYKGISWGRKNPKGSVTFYPIYDWSFRDVWKYINDQHLKYNRLYDEYYRLGLPITEMRVSNLIHEYTLSKTNYIQELEPDTYDRLVRAVPGISTTCKFGDDFTPYELPDAFSDWKEYRDYLLENLIAPEDREGFRRAWEGQVEDERIYRVQVLEVIRADVTHTINKDRTAKMSAEMKMHEREKK